MRRSFHAGRTVGVLVAGGLAVATVVVTGGGHASAATFPVTNNNASGAGSFEQAVLDAAANPGPDTITFDPATDGVPIPADITINGHEVTIVGNGVGATILAGELTVNAGGGAVASASVTDITVDEIRVNAGGPGSTTAATFTDVVVASAEGANINSGSGASTTVTLEGVEISAGGLNINSGFDGSNTSVSVDGSRIVDGISANSGESTTDVSIADTTVTVETGNFDVLQLNGTGTTVEANGSTFANGDVGVAVNGDASFDAVNSTFSDLAEAAVSSGGGTISLQNVTIADVAVGFDVDVVVDLEIGNTIITGVAGDACVDAQPASLGGNFVDDATCGLTGTDDQEGITVVLGALADNGGPTQTRLPVDGSPVIDGGVVAGCPATDQRGIVRPQDGDEDGVADCDSGAVEIAEVDATTTTIAVTTTTTVVAPTTTPVPGVSTTVVPTPILPPTGTDVTLAVVALALLALGAALATVGARRHT